MKRRSLRFGITITLLLFVSVSSVLFALVTDYVDDRMERSLLDETLDREFADFTAQYLSSQQHVLPQSAEIRSYLVEPTQVDSLPAQLSRLAPGYYHDVKMDGRRFHILHKMFEGKHMYIALDITNNEVREDSFGLFLFVGVILLSGITVWIGYFLSRRLIAPVTELAARVRGLEPGHAKAALSGDFAGSEVLVIAQAFDRFLERLDQFVEREHAFTRDASHELRTPLAVINTASELLLADARQADSARQPLLRIQRASRQMTRLTRALLFLAREIGSPAEDADCCQADVVAAEVVDSYRQLHSSQQVEIRLDTEPMTLPVPPELFEIVLANLLQNALTYTQQGHVRVELLQERLTVADTGSGIGPEDLPHIFERHYRGAGSRGIGRGLDLVKRVSDRFGWKLSVSSSPGQGTRFTVDFKPNTLAS